MRIGIMGGTFDPIHNGHIAIAEAAYEQFPLQEIWFLPNGNPPHKESSDIEASTEKRLNMVSLAIQDIPYFRLVDYEAKKEDVSYSNETLSYFREQYPNNEYSFIVGADSLFQFDTWAHPERIMRDCILLVACRDEAGNREELKRQIEYLTRRYHGEIEQLKAPHVPISSHEIRERRKHHLSIEGMVPDTVNSYILEEKLYES